MSQHYIVRVKSNSGVQFGHMELPEGFDATSHPLIDAIHTGPHPDEKQAWDEHRKLRNTENQR
jgi:hypothetical protein